MCGVSISLFLYFKIKYIISVNKASDPTEIGIALLRLPTFNDLH